MSQNSSAPSATYTTTETLQALTSMKIGQSYGVISRLDTLIRDVTDYQLGVYRTRGQAAYSEDPVYLSADLHGKFEAVRIELWGETAEDTTYNNMYGAYLLDVYGQMSSDLVSHSHGSDGQGPRPSNAGQGNGNGGGR